MIWVWTWKCWVYSQWNSHWISFKNGIMISKTIGYNGVHDIFRHTRFGVQVKSYRTPIEPLVFHGIFDVFPSCQVRVSRFYMILLELPSPSLPMAGAHFPSGKRSASSRCSSASQPERGRPEGAPCPKTRPAHAGAGEWKRWIFVTYMW